MSIPSIVKVNQPSKGKCGWVEDKFYFPFHRMGCCGDDRHVMTTFVCLNVETLDKRFWAKLAKKIEQNPYFDWDWSSLRKNLIRPNEAHIRAVCKIPNDKVWERFEEDGYVFLNRWYKTERESDGEDADDEDDEPIILPCGKNCFEDVDVEY